MRTPIAVLISIVVLCVGCSAEERSAEVKKRPSPSDSAAIVDSSTPSPTDGLASVAKLGDVVEIGAWNVRVTKVTLNANDLVQAADEYGKPPKGQYVLVDYAATYTGPERTADVVVDLHWTFTTTDHRIHEQEFVRTAAPAVIRGLPTRARKGGTIRYQAMWDLPPDQVKGGTLSVEGFDEDFDAVYADFKV